MPKILTEMKNVGKYLRATHHLYFQTSFFKTNGRQKRLRGCPLQNNFVWQNLGRLSIPESMTKILWLYFDQAVCPLRLHCIMMAPDSGEKTLNDYKRRFHLMECVI